jgi:hypothetical protein
MRFRLGKRQTGALFFPQMVIAVYLAAAVRQTNRYLALLNKPMQVTVNNGMPAVRAASYELTALADRPFIRLVGKQGNLLAELFVPSAVHPLHDRDDTTSLGEWCVAEEEGHLALSISAGSSVWQQKRYTFNCYPHRLSYEIEIAGHGRLAEMYAFGGYYSGHLRWGSGFFYSGHAFRQGFNPEPNTDEIYHFSPETMSRIDLAGVPLPGRGDWFFTPPPFCFAVATGSGWMSLGVEAQPGANQFTAYHYHGGRGVFALSLDYEGQTAVAGRYRLPAIAFDFGSDEYEVLGKHCQALRDAGYAPSRSGMESTLSPGWWREPIFCGWGAQCYLARAENGRAPDYARQLHYEQFLHTLAANGITPGMIVLDDKWQATYGENEVDSEKWPDLRAFIARQHDQGRKVLLWLKAWDPEGMPEAECICNAAGQPVAVDPTNPAYRRRLRESIRRMLSPEGYGADGFKIDFTARIPGGPGMGRRGHAWGLELMKEYLRLIYTSAKETREDALVMTHTPHPYLADVADMIRLNDINTGKDTAQAMHHRARVARIACPDLLIDTDNWPVTDRAAWRAYLPLQAELGVPSLYYATHIDNSGEPLTAGDYELIRRVWAAYRQKNHLTA